MAKFLLNGSDADRCSLIESHLEFGREEDGD
jgi:hypothetical protein